MPPKATWSTCHVGSSGGIRLIIMTTQFGQSLYIYIGLDIYIELTSKIIFEYPFAADNVQCEAITEIPEFELVSDDALQQQPTLTFFSHWGTRKVLTISMTELSDDLK